LLRTTIARLQAIPSNQSARWWNLLKPAADILNSQKIMVRHKRLKFSPAEITVENEKKYRKALIKADPGFIFSQYEIDPQNVKFQYAVGDIVRVKLIVTSSAAIGEKRSQISLEEEKYMIEDKVAYLSSAYTIEPAYRCSSLVDGRVELFDESDITLSK